MELPDLVGVIQGSVNGVPIQPNAFFWSTGGEFQVELRYVVINTSGAATGKFGWVGVLYKNGVKQLVHPFQWEQLGPWGVSHNTPSPYVDKVPALKGQWVSYEAKLLADVGDFVDESNEANNKFNLTFKIARVPD